MRIASRFVGFFELEELLRHGPADLSPEFQPDGRSSQEAARAWIAEAVAGGVPAFEWLHRRKDGTLVPCEVRLVQLPGGGKRLIRGSIIDNTERRRKERIQQATYRISEAVHGADDLPSFYRRVHETVLGLMPARNFYIALYDPHTEMFSFPYFVDEFDAPPGPKKLRDPLLLIHGALDANPGTVPLQSEKLYEALRGVGKTVRLVMLPYEDHGYAARETTEHVLFEMLSWFDRFVKNAGPRLGSSETPKP